MKKKKITSADIDTIAKAIKLMEKFKDIDPKEQTKFSYWISHAVHSLKIVKEKAESITGEYNVRSI